MSVLAERRSLVVDLREKIVAVHRRRYELIAKSRKTIQQVVAVRQTASTEKEIVQTLIPFFNEQGQSMVSRLRGLEKKSTKASTFVDAFSIVSLIFNPDEWRSELINRLLPVLAVKTAEAGVAHLMTLGIDVRRKSEKGTKATTASEWANENMGDWISLTEAFEANGLPLGIMTEIPDWMQTSIAERLQETFSQPYWDTISKTTMGDAERALSQGLSEGWSIDKMAKQLREHYAEGGFRYARRRSENIARTESGNALNGVRKDSVSQLQKELGPQVPIKQSWLSVLGNTTRAPHADLDGVPEDENGMWNLAGFVIPWPGHFSLTPEQRCNCQCSLTIEFGMDDATAQREIAEYWARVQEHKSKSYKHLSHDQSTHRRGGGVSSPDDGGTRVERAKRTHKPSTAEKQRRAEAEQARLAKLVKGWETDDNDAFDVFLGSAAIEVKCVMDNNNNKITMHPKSRRRKEKFAEDNNMDSHTVVIDVRGGKRKYYHKASLGAFRLTAMERVTVATLKERLG